MSYSYSPETLRSIVGNGSIPARGLAVPLWDRLTFFNRRAQRQGGPVLAIRPESEFPKPPKRDFQTIIRRVLKPVTLLKEPDMAVLLFYSSLSYTLYYCVTSSSSTLFKSVYKLNYAQIGKFGSNFSPNLSLLTISTQALHTSES